MKELLSETSPGPGIIYLPFLGTVQAGFPSPASDYMGDQISLDQSLIKHPSATYYFRATNDSMTGAFIPPGALLMIDRVEKPKNGSIVIAVVDGEFLVKRLLVQGTKRQLLPENPKYKPIDITEFSECEVWGVVIHIIIEAKQV